MASSAADFVDSQRLKVLTCEALLIWRGAAEKRGRDSVANGLKPGVGLGRARRARALGSEVRDNIVRVLV